MATHYEVLGVDPDASHDELKRAYLELALRYHPDRQSGADAAALERSTWRMREVNEAWQVLQSPGRRARYDDELAAERRRRDAAVRDQGRSWTPAEGADDDDLPAPAPEGPAGHAPRTSPVRPARGGFRPYLPLIVLGVLLVLVLVVTAYAGPREDDPDVETTDELAPGTCVQVYSDGEVEAVSCSGPSTGRVVSTVSEVLTCPPGSVAVPIVGAKVLCVEETP
jgi:hypothetical protein